MKATWAAMLLVLGAGVARADTVTFNFVLGGSSGEPEPFTTQGTFTGVDLGPMVSPDGEAYEAYRVTGVTGTLAVGLTITGLLPDGTYDVGPYGNEYTVYHEFDVITEYAYPGPTPYPRVVPEPIGLMLSNGERLFVITLPESYGLASDAPDLGVEPYGTQANFNVDAPVPVATPEPGTMGLVGTGVLGVVGMMRRRVRG